MRDCQRVEHAVAHTAARAITGKTSVLELLQGVITIRKVYLRRQEQALPTGIPTKATMHLRASPMVDNVQPIALASTSTSWHYLVNDVQNAPSAGAANAAKLPYSNKSQCHKQRRSSARKLHEGVIAACFDFGSTS